MPRPRWCTLSRPLWSVLLLAVFAAGCAVNPVTGRRQLALISESQEIQIGQQGAQEVEQSIGLVQDEALQQYVQRLGAALAAESERPNLPWRFRVVDDPTPNAFALPGGFIYVTRGLLALMDSEAELATVLGHEIGHVTARHSVSQLSRAQLAQVGLVLGQIFVPETQALGGLAEGGLGLLFLKYGRDAERQADDLGFRYALSEGYDVREMADVFAALRRAGEREGQSRLPSWMATHPAPDERIERVEARLAQLGDSLNATRDGAAPFMARIDNLVYGENPRSGYFRGSEFLHPDLRFRLTFPQGWQTRNLPQAVVAQSPQQDAIIQLTLAGQGGAENAARQFLSQQGVQPGQSARRSIQGLPGVISYFQAQTQQGVIQGIAAWVDYGGRTYQMVGYAPSSRFPQYDNLLQRVIGSFGALSDPQALAAQPNRLDIVTLSQAMTLGEFHRRYPSVVPIEEIGLINQVDDAAAVLPAGTRAKRVVRG